MSPEEQHEQGQRTPPPVEGPLFPQDSEDRERIREDIVEIEEPARRILEQIHTQIENGEYDLLLGEDASGRLPTLLFREVINAVYRKNGRPEIPTRFTAGSSFYEENETDSDLYIDKMLDIEKLVLRDQKGLPQLKKVLIVTDTVASGRSLHVTTKVLNKLGIDFDIVSLAVLENADQKWGKDIATQRIGKDIISGGMTIAPKIYRNDYSGVSKNSTEIHSSQGGLRPASYTQWSKAPQPEGFRDDNEFLTYEEIKRLSDEEYDNYYAAYKEEYTPEVKRHLYTRMRISREELHPVAEKLLRKFSDPGSRDTAAE